MNLAQVYSRKTLQSKNVENEVFFKNWDSKFREIAIPRHDYWLFCSPKNNNIKEKITKYAESSKKTLITLSLPKI